MSQRKIILASASPRRRELLATLDIPFEAIAPHFVEVPTGRAAAEEALYFAEEKAKSVETLCPDALVIASDTLIDCEGVKMGKPRDAKEAVQMLTRLSGKTHNLYTAVALFDTKNGDLKKHVEKVAVTFKPLTKKEIEDYVATGEPLGKAGAYAVQGKGRALVLKVEGDMQAVIGFPLSVVKGWLKREI